MSGYVCDVALEGGPTSCLVSIRLLLHDPVDYPPSRRSRPSHHRRSSSETRPPPSGPSDERLYDEPRGREGRGWMDSVKGLFSRSGATERGHDSKVRMGEVRLARRIVSDGFEHHRTRVSPHLLLRLKKRDLTELNSEMRPQPRHNDFPPGFLPYPDDDPYSFSFHRSRSTRDKSRSRRREEDRGAYSEDDFDVPRRPRGRGLGFHIPGEMETVYQDHESPYALRGGRGRREREYDDLRRDCEGLDGDLRRLSRKGALKEATRVFPADHVRA